LQEGNQKMMNFLFLVWHFLLIKNPGGLIRVAPKLPSGSYCEERFLRQDSGLFL
jgi:hypothetical protein